ncbi:hypothetical protein J6590_008293 [Homalodisca vitripennis]|nr:hypothetical protein J6590_008293 [Homalodisca vitripennis]
MTAAITVVPSLASTYRHLIPDAIMTFWVIRLLYGRSPKDEEDLLQKSTPQGSRFDKQKSTSDFRRPLMLTFRTRAVRQAAVSLLCHVRRVKVKWDILPPHTSRGSHSYPPSSAHIRGHQPLSEANICLGPCLPLDWVTAVRSCPCKHPQPAYPTIGENWKVIFKPLVSSASPDVRAPHEDRTAKDLCTKQQFYILHTILGKQKHDQTAMRRLHSLNPVCYLFEMMVQYAWKHE